MSYPDTQKVSIQLRQNSIAQRAVFVWTGVNREDKYSISFGGPNKYYKTDPFPLCFDNEVTPTLKLLRKSLELMGFTKLIELDNRPGGMPSEFYNYHSALLAIRP